MMTRTENIDETELVQLVRAGNSAAMKELYVRYSGCLAATCSRYITDREQMRDVNCPGIAECPVQLECRVRQVMELGSHHMFLSDILCVHADEKLLNESGKLELERASLISYSHGAYYEPGRALGHFGFSVRKKPLETPSKRKKPRKPDHSKPNG